MEYCLSLLYIAMDDLGIIWCMDAFMERRYKDWRFWGIYVSVIGVSFFLFNFVISGISILHTVVGYIIFVVLAILLFRVTHLLFLTLLVLLYHTVMYFISFATAGITAAILKMSIEAIKQTHFPLISSSVINYLLLLSICATIKRLHSTKGFKAIHLPILYLTFLFPVASLAVLLTLISIDAFSPVNSSVLSLCAIFLVIANIAVFLLLDWIECNEEVRSQQLALAQTIDIQTQNMSALGEAYSNQRKITHDFNSYLDTIASLIKVGDIENAKSYITKLQEKQVTRSLLVNTHHPIVDALLNQKAYAAKSKDIKIHFEVNNLSKLQLDSVDITTILGNLLDNAIEACTIHGGDMQIQVKVLLGNTLFFAVRNTCNPVKIVGDHIPTTKVNPQLHGFGLENVKTLLKKYGGDYAMEYDNGWFTFTGEIDNLPIS